MNCVHQDIMEMRFKGKTAKHATVTSVELLIVTHLQESVNVNQMSWEIFVINVRKITMASILVMDVSPVDVVMLPLQVDVIPSLVNVNALLELEAGLVITVNLDFGNTLLTDVLHVTVE